jgi:hypothetical protein
VNTEGFACPNRKCPSSGITDADIHAPLWRGSTWPGFAHPDLSLSGLPHHLHCPSPDPLVPSENSLPSGRHGADCASLWTRSFRRRACLGLPSCYDHCLDVSRLSSTRRPCRNVASAPSGSRTCSWTNCAAGCAATSRCSGSGWPSILGRRSFLCFIWVPARTTWRICSSTPCDRSWPPFCLPLFTSDGLKVDFSASRGPCWALARGGSEKTKVGRWQRA